MRLPRVFQFDKYKVKDFKEYLSDRTIKIHLERDFRYSMLCTKCGSKMQPGFGSYPVKIHHMPIFNNHCYLILRRQKGYCKSCKKVRTERLDFISVDSPHKSTEYAWWVGRLCEISAVKKVSELIEEDSATTWRLDYKRMKRMLSKYSIPKVKKICVDEVYARRKKQKGETRDDQFLTVICDLETRRVIWVSSSRRKEALDEFFMVLGKKACENIEVVATDMHDAYGLSVKEHCPNATLVWDRFHIMQAFDNALNEDRKSLHGEAESGSEEKRLSRGKFRFMFLKKASRRSAKERVHIDDLIQMNKSFSALEIIKESMHEFFNSKTEKEAQEKFDIIGGWIMQKGFKSLHRWHNYMETRWETVKNYFKARYTTALSEGFNNVIKTIKKQGYGYRNMEYFKLKIMQVCGYLNSKFIKDPLIQ